MTPKGAIMNVEVKTNANLSQNRAKEKEEKKMTPKITEKKMWSWDDVRRACIKNNLYTAGTNEEYDALAQIVTITKPTTSSIYLVAKDICEHSIGQTLSNVMFILANEAVTTTYKIEDEEIKENLVPMPGYERLAELAKEYE